MLNLSFSTNINTTALKRESHSFIIILFHYYIINIKKGTVLKQEIPQHIKLSNPISGFYNISDIFNVVMHTLFLHFCFRQRLYMYKYVLKKNTKNIFKRFTFFTHVPHPSVLTTTSTKSRLSVTSHGNFTSYTAFF